MRFMFTFLSKAVSCILGLYSPRKMIADVALRDNNGERQLADNVRPAIAYCDTELRYRFVNRHYAERHGLTPEQMVGKRVPEVVGETAWAIFQPHLRDCLAGRAIEFELELDSPHLPDQPQFVHSRYEPEWRDGRVIGLIAVFTNTTSAKHAEVALRESEATFRAMFDVSSVGHIEVEPETGRFLRANAAVCRLLGYTEAELLALTVFDITHPDDRGRAQELLRRMIAGESPDSDLETRSLRKDRSVVWTRVTANVIRGASGRPLRNIAVIQNIDARKQAEQALQASRARLQLALDAAQLGWWQYDPQRRMASGDVRFRKIFGVETDETSIEEIKKRVHPDDVEKLWAAHAATLDPVDSKPYAIELRLQRGDGETRWLEVHWLAYFEYDRSERWTTMVIGTVADITERKEREDKVHLLMCEVNHRAKNMLSVVQVIAHQTAANSPEDFIERFSERVQALSANQDLLVRSEWSGVEIEDLARAQLAHFADLIGSRITVQGPKLRLKPDSAQTVGLAIRELSTNAGKYGALSIDKGHVDLIWGTADGTLTINWTECDGPPVSLPQRRGFGTTVIEAMVRYNLRGTVNLNYAPSGLTWHLSCPAASALE
jgi:PAS domain S-box-containing protein